jgi:hypothetical protein
VSVRELVDTLIAAQPVPALLPPVVVLPPAVVESSDPQLTVEYELHSQPNDPVTGDGPARRAPAPSSNRLSAAGGRPEGG